MSRAASWKKPEMREFNPIYYVLPFIVSRREGENFEGSGARKTTRARKSEKHPYLPVSEKPTTLYTHTPWRGNGVYSLPICLILDKRKIMALSRFSLTWRSKRQQHQKENHLSLSTLPRGLGRDKAWQQAAAKPYGMTAATKNSSDRMEGHLGRRKRRKQLAHIVARTFCAKMLIISSIDINNHLNSINAASRYYHRINNAHVKQASWRGKICLSIYM